MLYLMLVIVFSRLSKKWWLFFILGWGTHYSAMPLAGELTIYFFRAASGSGGCGCRSEV